MPKWMCSADAHYLEPGDLWVQRMPKALRARAPKITVEGGSRTYWVEGRRRIKIPNTLDYLADGSPVPTDVPGRLKMLDGDGIWAESIIGSIASNTIMAIDDTELALESARIYNDFMAEEFRPHRHREVVLGLILADDIAAGVKEIERVAALGVARGVTMPINPVDPYFLPKYEPIWAAAAAHKLPISFHAGTGRGTTGVPGLAAANDSKDRTVQDGVRTIRAMALPNEAYLVMCALVGSGVLERYPDLQVVFVETGAGWLASALEAVDQAWTPTPGQDERGGDVTIYDADERETIIASTDALGGRWRYPLRPSEYVRRQMHATFQDEPGAIRFREAIGVPTLLWGSDFPHAEGTWPHSRAVVERLFAGVAPPERDAIVGGTFAKLYGIEVPQAGRAGVDAGGGIGIGWPLSRTGDDRRATEPR